jgi:hypothetical protein
MASTSAHGVDAVVHGLQAALERGITSELSLPTSTVSTGIAAAFASSAACCGS